jgi:cell wall-associated NlpC family hydrolase
MYGTEGWEFKELDYQPKNNVFNDIGIPNYSTIRYAADYARYFYKYGYVLYDQKIDGIITDISKINYLQPGDLVFWDTSESENADSRFKSISHIALVAENTNYYYQVTGKVDEIG